MNKQDVKKALRTIIEKMYYPDGTIEREIPYVNGKMHGVAKFYCKDGSIEIEIPFVRGVMHGFEKHYCKDRDNYSFRWEHGKKIDE